MRPSLALPLLACCAPAQELLWQLYSSQDDHFIVDSIGDFDGDGWADLLAQTWVNSGMLGEYFSMRILCGADGSVLADRRTFARDLRAVVGDFDGDGYQDYATSWSGISLATVEVWSPKLDQQLLLLSEPTGHEFGGLLAGRVDLDGDGRQDLLVGSTRPFTGDIRGYGNSGALLYTIPAGNAVVLDAAGLPDLDGDGCSEFVVGGVDYSQGFSRGYVALRSGRTGTVIRIHHDQQPGDLIGKPLLAAGDMDRDGVHDYATGNYWGSGARALITVWSGATGAVIREWTEPNHGISAAVLGGLDADLDGVVDVIGSSPGYDNGVPWPPQDGRVFVFSSRDGQELLHARPQSATGSTCCSYGRFLANLGVQPGSPYPVFALSNRSWSGSGINGIEVWRCTPAGASVTGIGCSSAGPEPTVGLRRVETSGGEQSRIVLGSAPPSAIAWCVVAPANASTFAGLGLPIVLDPLGFPGCSLYVPATASAARLTGITGFDRGYAEVDVPWPLVPTAGFHAAAQWLVLDPATGGHGATPRCEFRVQ